jgi:LmbE family N-acetylglucosaminyl deacetylase
MGATALHLPEGPLRLLCVGAHADDIEIGAGGTLLRLLAEHPGSEVDWRVLTATPEREREARASAAAFLRGAARSSVTVHTFHDGYLPSVHAEVKDVFEELKRELQPDVVVTHTGGDAHQDHRLLAELTWNTFRDHLVLEFEIPKYDGDLGRPNVFVPLARDVAARKVDLLLEHFPSQGARRWFEPETFFALLRLRGLECNARDGYAEAFHVRKVVL